MRSERIRRFLWRDIPLGLLLVAVVLVAIYLILQMGFDAPIRATLMFMVYMALVILICMFFVFHKRYCRLCLEDSGASHSDIGSTGLDYLNGRTIGKVVFWCVAIGVVLPVLQFTIYYILLLPALLINALLGGLSESWGRATAIVNLIISVAAAIASVVYLWIQFKKSYPPSDRSERTDRHAESA